MDFIDSLDLDTSSQRRKSDRVRSWYLLEQFKSLERNQLEAANKLRTRSYQEGILLREMNERRARRRLYDRFGVSERGPSPPPLPGDVATSSIMSPDDSYKSFCESQEDIGETLENSFPSYKSTGAISLDETKSEKLYEDIDFKSFEDKDLNKESETSVSSVVENVKRGEMADDIHQELDCVKRDVKKNLKLHLDTLMKNIQSIEQQTKLRDQELLVDCSYDMTEKEKQSKSVKTQKYDESYGATTLWSRVVRFAYQVMKLQHGNCYQEYSSQIFTAVLALDIFRRSLFGFCNCLQPYVSPIKFVDDESVISEQSLQSTCECEIISVGKNRKRYRRKICSYQIYQRPRSKSQKRLRNYNRNMKSLPLPKQLNDCMFNKSATTTGYKSSDVGPAVTGYIYSKEVDYTSSTTEHCTDDMARSCANNKVVNPMLKVVELIDNAIKLEGERKRI